MSILNKKDNNVQLVSETTEKTETVLTNDTNGKNEKDVLDKPAFSKYENVDFSKMSQQKLFNVIVELILDSKRLYQSVNKLNTEVFQYNNDVKTAHKDTSNIENKIDYIASKICPSLINQMNNGKKFTIDAKIAIIIDEVLQDKKRLMTRILKLNEQVKNDKLVLDELKAQLAESIKTSNEEVLEETKEFTEKDFETFAGSNAANVDVSSTQGSIVIKAIDLVKARASIDETGKKIIEAIGKEGISEYPLLLQYCLQSNTGITEFKFNASLENLTNNSILDMDIAQSVNRIRGVRLYSLSNEVGKTLFKEIFREKPVLSEKEKLKAENDNLHHGYSIKDVVLQLEEFGYTDVSMDRKKNTIPVSGANVWIPDIIAVNPVSGRKEYFEVEMGTHTQDAFNLKMDKANLKVQALRIIVPNKNVAENICRKIEAWKAKNLKKNSSITIYVQRFSELKSKEDGRVFAPADKLKISDVMNTNKQKKPIEEDDV